jgi:tRNA-modifying protein YgfZ
MSTVPRIRVVSTVELDGQYRALREEAGMLEREERRLLACRGPDAAAYIHDQLTNDIESLAPAEGCYAALLDRKAHMQADLRVLRISGDELLLDCEAAGREALGMHLGTYRVGRDVEFENLAESHTVLSVIGPAAATATGVGPLAPEHAHREATVGGATVRAVATDAGIDLVCARAELEAIRAALADAGVVDVDPAAAEIVRVEAGRPRFGLDMTTATIPQEAGINERAVNFEKGCYIGQETVARLHYRGKPNRHLRGLRLAEPVAAGAVVRLGERELGRIGTAVLSPAHGPIALAILRREAEPGATVAVETNGASVEAAVVELPFV